MVWIVFWTIDVKVPGSRPGKYLGKMVGSTISKEQVLSCQISQRHRNGNRKVQMIFFCHLMYADVT